VEEVDEEGVGFYIPFLEYKKIMVQKLQSFNEMEKKEKTEEQERQIHHHHVHAMFALFCLVAFLGVFTVFVHQYAGETITDSLTGAVATTTSYNKCTDYGNYIVLQNDVGWKKIKKDICTGVNRKYLRKVACVKSQEQVHAPSQKESYDYTYTTIESCDRSAFCALDTNGAAYCP